LEIEMEEILGLLLEILKNWKTKKWLTTSPFFEGGKICVFDLKNWKYVESNLKIGKLSSTT
jgi:hypothetical protein